MTKTEHYQLSQWEPTDKLSRADFNADNAAIDAAIKAVADTAGSKASAAELAAVEQQIAAVEQTVKFVKLGGPVVTTVANGTITFDLTNVDMSGYAALFLTYCAGAVTGSVTLSLNGTSLCTVCSNNRTTCGGTIWLVPFNENVAGWSGAVADASGALPGSGICDVQWNAISSLTLSGASYAGATATLFGVKN